MAGDNSVVNAFCLPASVAHPRVNREDFPNGNRPRLPAVRMGWGNVMQSHKRTAVPFAMAVVILCGAPVLQTRSQPQEFVTWLRAGLVEARHSATEWLGRFAPAATLPESVSIPLAPATFAPAVHHDIAPAKSKTPLIVQFG